MTQTSARDRSARIAETGSVSPMLWPCDTTGFTPVNTWQTVTDPGGSIAGAYLVQFPPQTYFIDRDGVLRKIQYGELLQSDVDLLLPAILR